MRSSLQVSFSVWKALFLREAVFRLSTGRAAWFWLLLEPVSHVILLMVLFGFVYHKVVNGIDGVIFIMTGLLGYFTFIRTATQCMNAISANTSLFTFRQVKPVDTVLVRAMLEGFIMLISIFVLLFGLSLFGYNVIPDYMLGFVLSFLGLWLQGVGCGLVFSVGKELVPEIGNIINLMLRPLYFISGIMFPAMIVPQPYRDILMYNPLTNGLEILRESFTSTYHTPPGTSLAYLYGSATVMIYFGLALHIRFSRQLSSL